MNDKTDGYEGDRSHQVSAERIHFHRQELSILRAREHLRGIGPKNAKSPISRGVRADRSDDFYKSNREGSKWQEWGSLRQSDDDRPLVGRGGGHLRVDDQRVRDLFVDLSSFSDARHDRSRCRCVTKIDGADGGPP